MNIYVFGNPDLASDNKAFEAVEKIKPDFPEIDFIIVKPNEDVPFVGEEKVIILDVVQGLEQVTLIEEDKIDKLQLSSLTSVHDFDLGFQLKYLKKLGKLGEIKIIGIPMKKKIDYSLIHSILRKLVAQDMQGS